MIAGDMIGMMAKDTNISFRLSADFSTNDDSMMRCNIAQTGAVFVENTNAPSNWEPNRLL